MDGDRGWYCAAKNGRDVHERERNAYCSWFKRKINLETKKEL